MSEYTAAQIAEKINGTVLGDADRKISGVNSLALATAQDLSFATTKYRQKMEVSKAGIILVGQGMEVEPSEKRTYIICEDADKSFGKICDLFTPEPIKYEPGIAPGAFVHPTAVVDPTASIGPNAVIQEQSLGIHYNQGADLLDYLADRTVFNYKDGSVYRSDAPGLGIEINEDVVREADAKGHEWKNPVWRTADGVVAEW